MQGCSNDDFLKPSLEDKLNFPLHIEKFGKAVANEIHLTEMGEIVVSVSEVMVGGVALIMSVLCVSDTDQFRAECAEKYRDCMDKKGPWSKEHSGGWGYTMCARCLEFCRAQHGVWDCPRPV